MSRFTSKQIALGTILGFLCIRLLYIAYTPFNLIVDEAYFWDWSRHLAWSYYDMGPMVAWIIRLTTSILPLTEFSVRLGAPISTAVSAWIIYLLAEDITGSSKVGFITILLYHMTPIGMAGGFIMTYYSPQFLFMTMTAYYLWQLTKSGDPKWWYLIGLSLGLGVLSHHMFAFFTLEIGIFVLLSKDRSKWLACKQAYLGLLIEIIVALPVIIWNFTHNLVMARHAISLMSAWSDFFDTFLNFLGGQAVVHTPLWFIAVIYGVSVSGYRGIKGGDQRHLLLFSLSAPVLILVALLSFGGRTEANWPITAYITGSISAVWVLAEKFRSGSRWTKNVIKVSYGITLALCTALWLIAYFPQAYYSVTGMYLKPKMDPANRLHGWEELGREVSAVRATMPEDAFVAANGYGLTAALGFYVEGNPQIYEIPVTRRYSQYDFWNDAMDVDRKDALFVSKRKMRSKVEAAFRAVELVREIIIRVDHGDEIRARFFIYRCHEYLGPANKVKQY
jgi:4-amino-4-deoxy-L-arabinose transferase-like glycosyltransferase